MSRARAAAFAGAAIAVVAAVFAYSAWLRAPVFGHYPAGEDPFWRWNSEYALKAARNWGLWGPLRLRFGIYLSFNEDPASPIGYYASYPPLFALLPWLASRLPGVPLSMRLLSALGLGSHLLFVAGLGLWARAFSRAAGARETEAVVLATLAAGLAALFPAGLFYFQQSWWPDLVVLPFYVLLAWLETAGTGDRPAWRRAHAVLLSLCLFADWLGHLLVAVILLRRVLRADGSWRPVARVAGAALGAQLALLLWQGGGWELWQKFIARAYLEPRPGGRPFPSLGGFDSYYGAGGLVVVLASAAVAVAAFAVGTARRRRPEKPALAALGTLLLPLFLHFGLLREHYIDHDYGWTKFGIAEIVVPFVALPMLLLSRLRAKSARVALLLCIAALACSRAREFPGKLAERMARARNVGEAEERWCDALYASYRPGDVLVSPTWATGVRHDSHTFGTSAAPRPEPGQALAWACFAPLNLTPDPEAFQQFAYFLDWPRMRPDRRFVGVFVGAPPPAWSALLRPGTARSIEGLALHDLVPPR